MPVDRFVLSNFTPDEMKLVQERFSEIESGLQDLVRGDAGRAKTWLNSLK